MSAEFDTIVAISTPPGRGGLGIVRLSGRDSLQICRHLLDVGELQPRRVRCAYFRSGGSVLDQVLVTYFRAPHSATGEDVIEISAHGSPVVLSSLVHDAVAAGARVADPGAFTRRAFLNGRLDLSQAEAVRDLIDAQTVFQARTAAQQLGGAVAARLAEPKSQLRQVIALMEAGIDFADDDVSVLGYEQISQRLLPIENSLRAMLESFRSGRVLREGLTVAIVGRPNVGKSSLFNRLLSADRAIVTATPGTTRDTIAESFDLDGVPLNLVDTAGIRSTDDEAERLGVERSWTALAEADLILSVFDNSEPESAEDQQLLARLTDLPNVVYVVNKSDLPDRSTLFSNGRRSHALRVSALTGDGIAQLRQQMLSRSAPGLTNGGELITNARHAEHLSRACNAIAKGRRSAETGVPHEMILVDLYDALREVDAITGQTTVEDILGLIFSTFCVGK